MNKYKSDLFDKCIKQGMPVTGNEDITTLEFYLEMAREADEIDKDILNDEIFAAEPIETKSKGLLGILGSLF